MPTGIFESFHVRLDDEQREELDLHNAGIAEDDRDLFMFNVKSNALLQAASFAGKVGQVPLKILYKGYGNMLQFK